MTRNLTLVPVLVLAACADPGLEDTFAEADVRELAFDGCRATASGHAKRDGVIYQFQVEAGYLVTIELGAGEDVFGHVVSYGQALTGDPTTLAQISDGSSVQISSRDGEWLGVALQGYETAYSRYDLLVDHCPGSDQDGDGVLDAQDNCPLAVNPDQSDLSADGVGDVCDYRSDSDGDGIVEAFDNCKSNPNAAQDNLDGDAHGDVCDADIDGDECANEIDDWPLDYSRPGAGTCPG